MKYDHLLEKYNYFVEPINNPIQGYRGLVKEFPSLSYLSRIKTDALTGIKETVRSILVDMETTGEIPPLPRHR